MAEFLNPAEQIHDYETDHTGTLIYWDCVEKRYKIMESAAQILDPHMFIGKIGQQNLLPGHFDLKPKDLEYTQVYDIYGNPVGNPVPPGISAFIFFGSKATNQHCIDSISKSHLGRDVTRKNRLYVAQVKDLLSSGWQPIFVPLVGRVSNPLHVILIPAKNLKSNEEISRAFIRWEC